MKLGFITYGCKVNQYETERIKQELLSRGNTESEDPDVYIINTCTVTDRIDREIARKTRQIRLRFGKKVLLTGCLAARKSGEGITALADWYVPNSDKHNMGAYPPEIAGADAGGQNHILRDFSNINKAFVKIEDGCNRFCAYCEIPYVRGSGISSRDNKDILEEIGALNAKGFEEIVITGINLGLFGSERKEEGALLRLLEQIKGLELKLRVRLSSIGPRDVSGDLIAFAAANRSFICPHFHMSAQSGSDAVLKMMGRGYTAKFFADKAEAILKAIPGAAVTTDIITGFPGETGEMHAETRSFLGNIKFSRVHIFTYSDRPDSKASLLPRKIDEDTKKARYTELTALAAKKEADFVVENIGRELVMLVEFKDKLGMYPGYTENYIKVHLENAGRLVNRLVPVVIREIRGGRAMAEAITKCQLK